jgi:membrane protease YdiL (CAAX protease family)
MRKVNHPALEGLYLLLEIILFFVLLALAAGLYFSFIHDLLFDVDLAEMNSYIIDQPIQLLLINYIPTTFIVLVILLLVHVGIFRRPEFTLGYRKKGLLYDFFYGVLMASALIFGGFLLMWASDQIDVIGFNWKWKLVLGFLLLFIVQSFQEEVIFRSYLIPTIENRLGTWAALIISSVAFMVIHLVNPGISIMGCLALLVGGVLMGMLFIIYRNIWAPTGFHMAWNYMQSSILGFEVSGISTYSWVQLREKGSDFFTGGDFGFEGSIFSVLFLLLCIIFLWKRYPDFTKDFVPFRKDNSNLIAIDNGEYADSNI